MNTDKPLVNRVANSGLMTINLEEFYPKGEIIEFDLKNYLFMELILKEKDFREALEAFDWAQCEGKHLLLFCSVDAVIPMWAYMLVASYAEPFVQSIVQGDKDDFLKLSYQTALNNIDYSQYEDKRIVIKGCSDKPVPAYAYSLLTQKLRPKAKSIMFGEPCSTVPVYKKARM